MQQRSFNRGQIKKPNMISQPFMKPSLLVLIVSILAVGKIRPQGMGHPITGPLSPGAKSPKCINRTVPKLEDISAKAGIAFTHKSSQVKKYIFESMTGGVSSYSTMIAMAGPTSISPMRRPSRWPCRDKQRRANCIAITTTGPSPM